MRPVLALFALCAAVIAQAPGGFKTYENTSAALTFFYPSTFQEVPLPPTEQLWVAKFVLKDKPEAVRKLDDRIYKAVEPQLHVYRFERQGPVTGPKSDSEPAKPTTVREAMEEGSRVSSWEEFEKRLEGAWFVVEDAKRPGRFDLKWRGVWPLADHKPVGFLTRRQEGNQVFGVLGITLSTLAKNFERQFDRMAGGVQLAEDNADESSAAAIDRIYAGSQLRHLDLRKKARSTMARGWKAVDTENYLIIHHSRNEALIKRIARDIEAMRLLYLEVFPPCQAMDQVSVVRVCRTHDEYRQYGGPDGTGGFWHPGNEELVFFDYSYTMRTMDSDDRKRMGDRKLTNDDSLLVLYHEALHQYMHYAVGEFAPHDWFNEGYGDYFSGAVIGQSSPKVQRIDPAVWRIHVAKDMCEYGVGWVPLKDLLNAERATFYHPARASHYYAGAWSFVFFLKHSKEATAHPKWSLILTTYFEQAKARYAKAIAVLGDNPDLAKKHVAGVLARREALAAALDGIELAELEKVWRQWVIDMRDPWPQERKKR